MKLSIYVYAVHLYNSNENPIIISNYSKLFHSEWLHCTVRVAAPFIRSNEWIEWITTMDIFVGVCIVLIVCLFVCIGVSVFHLDHSYGRWIRKTSSVSNKFFVNTPAVPLVLFLKGQGSVLPSGVALRCDMRRFIFIILLPI